MSYTSKAAVELILSATGEDDLVEDLSVGDQSTLWTAILTETDSLFNLYLCDLYEAADIAVNNWVEEKAKWVAAYYISRRRGNPGYFMAMYEEILEQLQMIRDGKLKLPANDGTMLAASSANMPAIMNVMFDDRNRISPLRYDTITSGGETGGTGMPPYAERWWSWG